jgi:hypothetical protein
VINNSITDALILQSVPSTGLAEWFKGLSSKCEVLSSNSSSDKEKKERMVCQALRRGDQLATSYKSDTNSKSEE